MIVGLFHTFFYNPIYNLLVVLVHVIPGGDVGLAVVIITILIRFMLLPFSLSAARTQHAMSSLNPKLKELRELHKGDKKKIAEKTVELYKEEKVNPFSSIITIFLQIPILLALYMVFRYDAFPLINAHLLYPFISTPQVITMKFLGVFDVAGKSITLAIFAGITQYFQATFALARTKSITPQGGKSADFTRIIAMQMRFVFPFIIAAVAYSTSGAIALYFITTNIFGALQEIYLSHSLGLHKDKLQINPKDNKVTQ